jgi:hypothetical protein
VQDAVYWRYFGSFFGGITSRIRIGVMIRVSGDIVVVRIWED